MKKWCYKVIILWFSMVLIWGTVVLGVDPFYHYHSPFGNMFHGYDSPLYQNDGIAKNFKYDAVITGTSTSQKYSVIEAEDLFGKRFVRLSYPGEGFRRISEGVRTALESKNKVETVIWSFDPIWFITESTYEGRAHDEYPEYLYNSSIWDDCKYLYNLDLMVDEVIPNIMKTIAGEKASFDAHIGRDITMIEYDRGQRENIGIDEAETQSYFECIRDNIEINVTSLLEQYPDVRFMFIIAPYSIAWWDSLYQAGDGRIERRLEMEEYVIRTLLEYENVSIYSFNDDQELVCNLTYYSDSVHPTGIVPSYVLHEIAMDRHRITKDNCDNYFQKEWVYYTTFDYDGFFEAHIHDVVRK